jgi:palmitoyltransferase
MFTSPQKRKAWDRQVSRKIRNRTIRYLQSPAPVRFWVYNSLLAQYRLFDEWSRPSMDDGEREEKPKVQPYLTRLRLALGPIAVHFANSGYVKEETLRMLETNICKKTLEETRRSFDLRSVFAIIAGLRSHADYRKRRAGPREKLLG